MTIKDVKGARSIVITTTSKKDPHPTTVVFTGQLLDVNVCDCVSVTGEIRGQCSQRKHPQKLIEKFKKKNKKKNRALEMFHL